MIDELEWLMNSKWLILYSMGRILSHKLKMDMLKHMHIFTHL
jgi:hypothetical protein